MRFPTLDFSRTLRLRHPFGQTLALAVCFLVLISAALEAAARLWLDGTGAPTAIGSDNPTLDVKFGVLDRLAERQGRIDCIFLGSSVVLNGFDPAAFADAYRAAGGNPVVCYNFGVPALTARTAGLLAEVLVERYRPRLLLYGLTARDLAAGAADAARVYRDAADTPWIAAQRGSGSLHGWIVEQSSAYRHYLAARDWMRPDFASVWHSFTDAPAHGYLPFHATRPFDPATIDAPSYFREFQVDAVDAAGLRQVIAQNGRTRVLLVEMPLPGFMLDYFPGGRAGYEQVIDAWSREAAVHGVDTWTTSPLDLIPMDGWAEDGHHVNHQGAQVLSRWLGEQAAGADLLP